MTQDGQVYVVLTRSAMDFVIKKFAKISACYRMLCQKWESEASLSTLAPCPSCPQLCLKFRQKCKLDLFKHYTILSVTLHLKANTTSIHDMALSTTALKSKNSTRNQKVLTNASEFSYACPSFLSFLPFSFHRSFVIVTQYCFWID